jgi:hypothetical protein
MLYWYHEKRNSFDFRHHPSSDRRGRVVFSVVGPLLRWFRLSGSPDTSQPMVAGTPDDGSGATSYPYDIQETGDGYAIERFSAPDFSLPRLGGGEIRLSDYRGKKPVILTFFATWCPNCRRDMPAMSVVYGDISDRIEIHRHRS